MELNQVIIHILDNFKLVFIINGMELGKIQKILRINIVMIKKNGENNIIRCYKYIKK